MVPEVAGGHGRQRGAGAGGAARPLGRRWDWKGERLEGTEAQGDEEGEKLDAREAGLAEGQVALPREQRPGACGPRNVREGQFSSPTRRGALLSSARLGVIFGPTAIRESPLGTCVCIDIAGSETHW